MFRNTYQAGFLSILYSIGSKPLQIWDSKVRNGHIKRITDGNINSSVIEICGSNVSTTYITCPAEPKKTLGIKLPFLVLIVKNLNKYFTFEVTILDDKNVNRRFRASNYQSTTRVKPFICTMPLRLDAGWNQIQFNLADFTARAYGTNYVETLRVQIHANCRIRRIYFEDKLYAESELPAEFRLFVPPSQKGHNTLRHSNQGNMLHDHHEDAMHMQQHEGMIDEHGQQHHDVYEGQEYQDQELYQDADGTYVDHEGYVQHEGEHGEYVEHGDEAYAVAAAETEEYVDEGSQHVQEYDQEQEHEQEYEQEHQLQQEEEHEQVQEQEQEQQEELGQDEVEQAPVEETVEDVSSPGEQEPFKELEQAEDGDQQPEAQ